MRGQWPGLYEANMRLTGAGMASLPGWFHPDHPPHDPDEHTAWREYKQDLEILFKNHVRGVYDETFTTLPAEYIRAAIQRGRDAFHARKRASEAKAPLTRPKIQRPDREWLRDLGRIQPSDIPKDVEAPPPERAALPPLASLLR